MSELLGVINELRQAGVRKGEELVFVVSFLWSGEGALDQIWKMPDIVHVK